jgi:hypothetical protein
MQLALYDGLASNQRCVLSDCSDGWKIVTIYPRGKFPLVNLLRRVNNSEWNDQT